MANSGPCITDFSVSILKKALICPFRTALGAHRSLENILFTLKLKNGIKGYGEAGIATHITGETLEETSKNLKLAGANLLSKNICDWLSISSEANQRLCRNKSAVAAIEMAALDAFTKKMNLPLWKFFGNSAKKLTTDITIVISDCQARRA